MRFNEAKATQAAAYLISKQAGPVKYILLIKLLYYADRESLGRWGRAISTDRYVSMDNGPVLSRVYELIMEEPQPDDLSYWARHITRGPEQYDVQVVNNPGYGELSDAEVEVLDQVFAKYGHQNRFDVCKGTHLLPEWRDPKGSSLPLNIEDILMGLGKSPDEVSEILSELDEIDVFSTLFLPPQRY